MKKKTLYKIILLIIIIIFLILMFTSKKLKSNDLFQDFLFTKLFGTQSLEEETPKQIQYIFDISYRNMQLKNVNLQDTINAKTLVNEKIAPGTSGEFDIVLRANKATNYKINFISKNNKPKNLKFVAKYENVNISKEKDSLEDLENNLVGTLKKDEQKIITINWYWNYEISEEENKQDTYDAENLKKYEFDIYTIGEEEDVI